MIDKHQKSQIALRHYLLGKGYYKACRALEWVERYHTGTRKDGVTPEKVHPISVTLYLTTLESGLLYPEETYAVGLMHDIREDCGVSDDAIRSEFGALIADGCEAVSKKINGVRKSDEFYFDALGKSAIGSVVKGGDRINNKQTMVGVFTVEKQREYIEETRRFILPMLKAARHRFPEQFASYQNEKLVLESQIELIEAIHSQTA
jgi:(p)ppGpp synthase/HD superfamily hydrolase